MADRGDGDDRSGNRKRKHTSLLDILNGDSEVAENDVEVFNNDQINGTILLKTAAEKIIPIKVKGSNTIGSIKLKIQTLEGIPFDQQELIFNGMVLEDINTLANLRIKNGSSITIVCKSFMNISIKNLEGKIICFLDVKPIDTIASVKANVKIKEGIPVDEQVLIFNKMVLGDSGTLFDFHIKSESALTLVRKSRGSMKIFIKTLSGETMTEEVKPWYTIGRIKAKIQGKVHISYDEQELIFNEVVLQNINTLADYNITRESTLTLTRSLRRLMQIFITTLTGITFTLDVKPSDTIYNVKANIQDKVHIHKVNIPSDEQELIFDEMVLHNDDTLADYDIKIESTLTLVGISRGAMQIFIKIHKGKTITLEVKSSDTIRNLKAKIFDKEGYSTFNQVLVFDKQILEDGAIVAAYNMQKESTVHLFTR